MKLTSLHFKKSLGLSIAAMLIISALIPIVTGEINKTGTYFWVDPERNIVGGTSFTIDIKIEDAPANDTRAWGLKLSWNKTVLQITGVTEGTFLKGYSAEGTSFQVEDLTSAQSKGSIGIGCTIKGDPATLAGGDGKLCNVTFSVIGTGKSPLNLDETSLINRAGAMKYYPNNDGFFKNVDVHDVAITGVTANVSEVDQGGSVGISVTVLNEGNFAESGSVKVVARPKDPRSPSVTIGTQGFSLGSGGSTTLSFTWVTTNDAGELYDIVSNATITGYSDDDPHDNVYIGPEVRVVSEHDLKIADVQVLTPEVDKSNNVMAAGYVVVMNFTGVGTERFAMQDLVPCKWYNATSMLQRVGYDQWAPLPSTWWHIMVAGASPSTIWSLVTFHVDSSNPVTHTFHIDRVINNGTEVSSVSGTAIWAVAELVGMIEVTVKNEGKNTETSTVVVVAVNATGTEFTVGSLTVKNLNVGETRTLYFGWSVGGIKPGTYTIKANVAPVTGEETKNLADNTLTEGTIEVIIYDVAVVGVDLLTTCNPNGFHPVVRVRATMKNMGTKLVKVVALFIAVDTTTGAKIVFGQSLGVTVKPDDPATSEDESITVIETMSPYLGWNTLLPGLSPPYPKPVPGRGYVVLATIYPYVGRDDNPKDDANYYAGGAPWTLPVVQHDVTGYSEPGKPTIKVTSEVYRGESVKINVTVVNQVPNPAQTESVTVSLYNGTTLIGTQSTTLPGMHIITFWNLTGPGTIPITEIKPCQWYYYNLTLGGTTYGNVPAPSVGWWELKFPVYDYKIYIDQVESLGGTAGYRFHVSQVIYMWTGLPKDVVGYPLPATMVIAWKLQPQTLTFTLDTTTGLAPAWYSLNLNATITIDGYSDDDPCDNKATAYAVFKVSWWQGDVNLDKKVTSGDMLKLKIILTIGTADPLYPVGDVNLDGKVTSGDMLALKIILTIGSTLLP